GQLGRGGYGEVWRASELLPDGSEVRQVALKLLAPELAGADWGREARALGALRHRALITVYSAGLLPLDPPLPFVAMELLEGETLAQRLQQRGPLPWRRALDHVAAVAEALDASHAQGILHLDVKPSNLLIGPDERPRLIDFGVARHRGGPVSGPPPAPASAAPVDSLDTAAVLALPSAGAGLDLAGAAPAVTPGAPVVGTPGFLAPEVLEGHTPTPAADAYALGACLFQLLTGRLPQRAPVPPADPGRVEAWRAELWASTLAGDRLDLRELAPGTPGGVVALVEALLALDPGRRPAGLGEACRTCLARPFGVPDPPYLGLRAYGPEAEGLLFGRDDDSERLAAELAGRPMLALQGASGSGKSSLAMAGVVPALARSFVDGRDDWVAVTVRPGHDLGLALERAREQHGERVGLVLLVDQLEEAVTQLGVEQKARFVVALGQHAAGDADGRPRPGLRVLCTLREDYTTRLAALGALGELLERAVRFVAPPSVASGRAIVLEPARLAGVAVDDERPVVDDVLKELRSDEVRLPLVAFALSDWWAARRDGVLPAEAWNRIGGVAGALSRHADATLDALPPPARGAARDMCLRLVHFDEALARDRVPEAELRSFGADHVRALDAFLAARLVSV
ncbi:MAG: serine/threonine protein kinase, partial [Myxococcales bacterium]